ncbi:MAG: nucleoside-diphosphate kinase [Thaumarchaeota archaeon]|nr:nucleoside-diphosphate kinase [Nitrososphaerota archaeon]
MEQTLFIIKPDAVKRRLVGEIIKRFENKNFKIIKLKMFAFTNDVAKEFYSIHKEKSFFNELISFITSGAAVAVIIEGDHAIQTTRIMVGSTKSFDASPGSIRGDYSLGITSNIIHASDSKQSFEIESNIIFNSLK